MLVSKTDADGGAFEAGSLQAQLPLVVTMGLTWAADPRSQRHVS